MNLSIRLHTSSLALAKFCVSCFFATTLAVLCCSKRVATHEDRLENFLLCKFCGADAADIEYALNLVSPLSLRAVNQTLAGRLVLLQTVKNPADIYIDIITVKKSNCVGFGEWKKSDTWFPGYAWKVCVCQPWGHFLGWIFEPVETLKENQRKASENGFYALVNDNILTEQFSNSLLITPKSYKS